MAWEVRPATSADARGIAVVHVAAWQEAYRHIFPAGFLEALSVDRRTEGWARMLSSNDMASARRNVFVAVANDDIVGFISSIPSRDDDGADIAEIGAIYVDPARWRSGAGAALMRVAVDDLIAAGYTEATLWVLDDNPRARSFYENEGWYADGAAKRETIGGVEITEVRYRRKLTSRCFDLMIAPGVVLTIT